MSGTSAGDDLANGAVHGGTTHSCHLSLLLGTRSDHPLAPEQGKRMENHTIGGCNNMLRIVRTGNGHKVWVGAPRMGAAWTKLRLFQVRLTQDWL